jgi:hypothetical protein
LRADGSSSKLDNTSAETAAPSVAPPSQTSLDRQDSAAKEDALPARGSPPTPLPSIPPPPIPAVAVTEPTVAPPVGNLDIVLDLQLGDTPMISRWKQYGLQALLAAALSAAPAVAGPDTDKPPVTDSQKLEAIQAQLGDLKDTLKSLDMLRVEMAKLRADTTILLGLQDRISGLSERIGRLEHDMEAVKAQLSPIPPTEAKKTPIPPAPNNSAIRLRNTYPIPVSIVVNGLSYQLAPGETYVLNQQTPGNFTYEVLGIQQPKTVVLAPNETLTISVFPR